MVKWGIISTGSIAGRFAEVLNKMDSANSLGGVASRDAGKAKAFALEFNAPAHYGSYEELAADPAIDAIYIATPNSLHYEHACLCLNAGKHVLCEKPFTTNASQARDLYAKAREKKLFLMDGMWIVHTPLLQKLRSLLDDGIIGDIQHIRADFGFTTTGARKDRMLDSSLGGGALLDVGVYNIGFAHFVMGSMPSVIKAHLCINEYGTDSFGSAVLEYPGCRTAVLTSSIGVVMPVEGVIYGTKGRIFFPHFLSAQSMTIFANGKEPEELSMPFDIHGFEYQIREAGNCIQNGLLTSGQMPEALSVGIMQTLDDIRSCCGLRFSFEK